VSNQKDQKAVIYNPDLLRGMLTGVNKLADTVKTTLGPRGRSVMIEGTASSPLSSPLITDNGANAAREIQLEDSAENMGAQIIREIASRTNNLVGDGTTTAIVLAQYIISEGYRHLSAGAHPLELKKGIQGACHLAVRAIGKIAKPVHSREAIERIACLSARDIGLGTLIADALARLGVQGVIALEASQTLDTSLKLVEGMQFEKGYVSPSMASDTDRMIEEMNNPLILITDRRIKGSRDLIPALEVAAASKRSLLIIAEELSGEALAATILNRSKGRVNATAVYPPAYGEGRRAQMEDIAILTGGAFITEELGLDLHQITFEQLGSAASVRVDRHTTTIIGGAGNRDAIASRIARIKAQIEHTDYAFDKRQLQERLAKLVSGTATIRIGAATESEFKEKKLRAENALRTARAALEEGVVPGGGTAYINCMPAIEAYAETMTGDSKTGARIVLRALREPTRLIANNAGMEGGLVVANVMERPAGVGFNVFTGRYVDMLEAGIMDSAKVVTLALQSSSSAASVFLTAEAAVVGVRHRP
jgi:chaperonin GroEL